jgi:hypothetical protein
LGATGVAAALVEGTGDGLAAGLGRAVAVPVLDFVAFVALPPALPPAFSEERIVDATVSVTTFGS